MVVLLNNVKKHAKGFPQIIISDGKKTATATGFSEAAKNILNYKNPRKLNVLVKKMQKDFINS
ncbi:hypothetical protein [Mycoplasma nasistruthionis]|uniref:Uncharacterized protein n=1 Tax=Mycoplasma nasistruthionis TaxID=353852 RepID=A0A5B7XVW2_9MOLU|nr:hypothetical protein [Mycoplasma nasistruthionis]QCZ36634.1 hypothetical protein FG904_01195 [Mycoplasma nasistruthionis]